jgi:putative membrane protein
MSDPNARARAGAILAAVVGLVLATVVIAYANVGSVFSAIRPIGAHGFLPVIAVQMALFAPLGLAWWLVSRAPMERSPVFILGRLMREAASDVLPFSQLGGIVIAARVAVLGGITTGAAFGSSIVDITLEVTAQLVYTLAGVALLAHHLGDAAGGHHKLLFSLIGGVAIVGALVAAFALTQKRGLVMLEKVVRRMAPAAADHAGAVSREVEAAYANPLRLWGCLALHIAAWFGGAAGAWMILGFIGHPLPFSSVVAIESLLFAIRNAAFFVPSGLGVQEGAYALLGPLFGLSPEAALALSLIKRARDVAIGAPALLTWQLLEGRRRLRLRESEA